MAGFSGRADARNEIDSGKDSKGRFYPLTYGNVSISDCKFRIESLLIPVFDTESFRVLATAVGVANLQTGESAACAAEVAAIARQHRC
jgi:hypothetical protein